MTHLIISQVGYAGIITLNRPEALNALTIAMVRDMSDSLIKWQDDDTVKLVIIRASAPRALCGRGCKRGCLITC